MLLCSNYINRPIRSVTAETNRMTRNQSESINSKSKIDFNKTSLTEHSCVINKSCNTRTKTKKNINHILKKKKKKKGILHVEPLKLTGKNLKFSFSDLN